MNVLNRGIDQGVEKPQFKCPQCPDKVYSSHKQLSNHTLGTIHILRKHVLGLFWPTHPPCKQT